MHALAIKELEARVETLGICGAVDTDHDGLEAPEFAVKDESGSVWWGVEDQGTGRVARGGLVFHHGPSAVACFEGLGLGEPASRGGHIIGLGLVAHL